MRVRVIQELRVAPPASGGGAAASTFIPFTFFDVIWLHMQPVERVFFYRCSRTSDAFRIGDAIPRLTSSISQALQLFYPLAGRIYGMDDDEGRRVYGIRYTPGDSVLLKVAESEEDMEMLAGDGSRRFASLRSLLPDLSTSGEVMALQVTVFQGQGFSMSVTVHHSACDGRSSLHFLKTWAAACRNLTTGSPVNLFGDGFQPPIFDRTIILDFNGLYSIYLDDWKAYNLTSPEKKNDEEKEVKLLATFVLTKERIEKLKQYIVAKQGGDGGRDTSSAARFRCSTFVAAMAHTWRCWVKTRVRLLRWSGKVSRGVFAVDCRARLNPPIPEEYFGNCIGACFAEVMTVDLAGDDGFYVAAEAIGTAITKVSGPSGVLDGAESLLKRAFEIISEPSLSVAGSPKLRVYDVDFGWGRPAKVEVPSIGKTGAISLAETRGSHGEEDGGLEIGIVLSRSEMETFSSFFLHDDFHLS